MDKTSQYLNVVLEDFQQFVKKSECFLEGDNSVSEGIKTNVKQNYDISKSEEIKFVKSDALPELIIRGFDLEQVWQQIELQNNALLTRTVPKASILITAKDHLIFTNLENELLGDKHNEEKCNEGDEDFNDAHNENQNTNSDSETESSELDLNDQTSDQEDVEDKLPKTNEKKSVVDDAFFKLSEMEDFLNKEEKIMEHGESGSDSEESNSEVENINLFETNSDEEDNKIKTAKFKDFFVAKEDDSRKRKRNKFLEDVISNDEVQDNDNREIKSTLELRQERLNKKIQEIEENNISEKPWQLRGEITADSRPQNSLLEEIVEFDLTSRPAPVITEQTTLQLDDLIKQRIKDRAFDSVIRKIKPVETPLEYKKKLVLDQEKSKHSLAQIYEKEFLEQQAALDPENADKDEVEPELHKEVKTLMTNLFNKLDALSNFHFTPKPAIPELRVVNNLPAVSMEEVAPVAATDSALLAPEEVRNKVKGDIIGKSERTTTDKNRERRKKKQKQRAHLKEKQKSENIINRLNTLGNKYNKEKLKKQLQIKDKNVDKMDDSVGRKAIKSSKAFFTHLQEEVQTHISNKLQSKRPKKNKQQIEAKKIKL